MNDDEIGFWWTHSTACRGDEGVIRRALAVRGRAQGQRIPPARAESRIEQASNPEPHSSLPSTRDLGVSYSGRMTARPIERSGVAARDGGSQCGARRRARAKDCHHPQRSGEKGRLIDDLIGFQDSGQGARTVEPTGQMAEGIREPQSFRLARKVEFRWAPPGNAHGDRKSLGRSDELLSNASSFPQEGAPVIESEASAPDGTSIRSRKRRGIRSGAPRTKLSACSATAREDDFRAPASDWRSCPNRKRHAGESGTTASRTTARIHFSLPRK